MAIVLGLTVQLAVLACKFTTGAMPKAEQILVDFAGGVTWATVVCTAVALGTVAARHVAGAMGLLGLLFAPLAWAAAKGVQRGMQKMVELPVDSIGPLVVQVGLVKTVEYGLLGFLLGRLIRRPESTLGNHALLGLVVGVIFGAAIIWLNVHHAPANSVPMPKLLAIAVNEILFPIGCSIVIYFIAELADRHSALERVISGGG